MSKDLKQQFPKVFTYFQWKEFPATTFINKYLLKDKDGQHVEQCPTETLERVMGHLALYMPKEPTVKWLKKILGKDYRPDTEYSWLYVFMKVCNNFKGVCPQGSILSAAGNSYYLMSLSNCFVISPPKDDIGDIFRAAHDEAQLMKRRGGVGLDLSFLRPRGAKVENAAGTSSGAQGWMDYFSNVCRAIGQNGRRGALMLTLSIKHPDALFFAQQKADLTKVTGANVSLLITDEFMHAVRAGGKFIQQWPVNSDSPTVVQEVDARELWQEICRCAWAVAEPGLIFWDNATKELPADYYEGFKSSSTNPCQPFDAVVCTKRGLKRFGDLVIGDVIWSETGWTKVTNKVLTGVKPTYKYITTAGYFYGTEDHRVVCEGQKIQVGEAESVDILAGPSTHSLTLDPADIIDGLVIGDGTYHEAGNRIYLNIGDKDTDYFISEVRDLIGHSYGNDKCYKVETTIRRHEMALLTERVIPNRFIYGSPSRVAGFLRGLYSANGAFLKRAGRVTLKSTSLRLIEQVQLMLSSLGIRSYFTTNQPTKVKFSNGEYLCKKSYDLNISTDRDKFFHTVGFIQKEKNNNLRDYLDKEKSPWAFSKPKKTYDIIEVTYEGDQEVFDITVDNEPHTYWTGGLNVSNCSEIILSENDSCRLVTICLTMFVKNKFTEQAYFDYDLFESHVRSAMRMLDGVVSAEIGVIDRILEKVRSEDGASSQREVDLWEAIKDTGLKGRRTGLGTHGLADTLVYLQKRYDSDEALQEIEKIYRTLRDVAYDESVEMSKEYGPFPIFDWDTEKNCPFIQRLPENLKKKIREHGRRNISILTSAPTGTISAISQVSSGLEPIFRLMYTRRRKVNDGDIDLRVDFIDDLGDRWQNHQIFHDSVQEYLDFKGIVIPTEVQNDEQLMNYLPDYFVTSDKIDWRRRVEIQGVMQSYIDHSISSTINLPADVKEEVVAELYELGWEKGLKGITVYRDGCRSGVLVSSETADKAKDDSLLLGRPESIQRIEAPQRPKSLPCQVHTVSVQGEPWVVIVGLLNGTVYEVFAGEYSNTIPKKTFSGNVVREGKKKYILEFDHQGKTEKLDINHYFKNKTYEGVTRLLSMSLRHHTPLEYVTQQLSRSAICITGFEAAVSRVLKKYIKLEDLQKIYSTCVHCESKNVAVKHQDGCVAVQCLDCNVLDSKCN